MPIKINGYSNKKRLAKKHQRQLDAQARREVYQNLTKAEKLARIQSRRGESKRELDRLNRLHRNKNLEP